MRTHNLGYPRIGSQRELKKSCEKYWAGNITIDELLNTGRSVRRENWALQQNVGIDLIPVNDFSFYDHVLDTSLMVGNIPPRFNPLVQKGKSLFPDLYFAMARGYQNDSIDITALEMTKWFDTNYHYIVPEFYKNQQFNFASTAIVDAFVESRQQNINAKPVILGPVSYLLLGKEKEKGFQRINLLDALLPVYKNVLDRLCEVGATHIQIDEPYLVMDLYDGEKKAFTKAYQYFSSACPGINILLATYFGGLDENLPLACSLPVNTLHVDLVRGKHQLDDILTHIPQTMSLSLGVVDGRNIWKNDFSESLEFIDKAVSCLENDRIWIAPSCSLLHSPCDLDMETNEASLPHTIKQWMSFAKQKLSEIAVLYNLSNYQPDKRQNDDDYADNKAAIQARLSSQLIHNQAVQARLSAIQEKDFERDLPFEKRKGIQAAHLNLPVLPTTTIGSFPQTKEIREIRSKFRQGLISEKDYINQINRFTHETIKIQEEIGLDVLVHGEFERNDMVEYFGEQMSGFTFTQYGWVQSYGSRCVKPPIIYGDISRGHSMTSSWVNYAQSLTKKPIKGMLTGPITILQWSFVRNDQPRSTTATQIALAILDEVLELEQTGIKIIQVDEPAIREGLPLKKADWAEYLDWAVKVFRLSVAGVQSHTQIHTHMCYSEFNDILSAIAKMDADVITIETSRSQMELLDAFINFKYPNDIGPGVYDIHSPRIPSVSEIETLLHKAIKLIPVNQLWVNPDCGLKTRHWDETKKALKNMVKATISVRNTL